MKEIERIIGKKFERKEVPTPRHIIEKQLYNLADRIEKVEVDDAEMEKYTPGVIKKLGWLSSEDLIKRVLSLEFNRLLDYYRDAPEIDIIDEKPSKKSKDDTGSKLSIKNKDRRTAEKGMARIFINLGKNDGFYAGNLIDMLNHMVNGNRVDVGRIDLMPGYSLFDVRNADARRVVEALTGSEFMGRRVFSEVAKEDKDYARAATRKTRESSGARRDSSQKSKRKPRR